MVTVSDEVGSIPVSVLAPSSDDDKLLARTVQEKTVRVRDCDINYIDEGSGDIIVFLHNGGGFWQCWANQIRDFAKTNRVLALDWPGFGKSTGVDEPLTVDLTADILEAFVNALNLTTVVLVGNCIGASTAIRYQNLHPEKVRGLVLMNICPGSRMVKSPPVRALLFGLPDNSFKRGLRGLLRFMMTRRIVARQFPGVLFGGPVAADDPLWVKYVEKLNDDQHNESRIKLLLSVNTFTLKDFIQTNDTIRNSLLIWGRENRTAPLSSQGYFHQEVCQIDQMEVIPDAGHLTMYEAPDQVTELIRNHVSRL